jgi:hypothetical protein
VKEEEESRLGWVGQKRRMGRLAAGPEAKKIISE